MSALFAAVARQTTVLAKYAVCAGNFAEILDQILPKIAESDDESRYTYSYEKYRPTFTAYFRKLSKF